MVVPSVMLVRKSLDIRTWSRASRNHFTICRGKWELSLAIGWWEKPYFRREVGKIKALRFANGKNAVAD